jgi:hypothetical protein
MILVIDDERTFAQTRSGDFTIAEYARTSNEGLAMLARVFTEYACRFGESVHELWLDHDLGGDDTIIPVVDFLYVMGKPSTAIVRMPDVIQNIYIHSQNPTAADVIIPLLAPYYGNVRRMPLPELV